MGMGDNLLIIANLVAERARENPDLDVVTFEDQGSVETRTYRDLWQNGQRLAAGLAAAGVNKGDRFALLIQNHPEQGNSPSSSSSFGEFSLILLYSNYSSFLLISHILTFLQNPFFSNNIPFTYPAVQRN